MYEEVFLTDPEFQRVIPVCSLEAYHALENDLLLNGNNEPIIVWNRTIVYDYNRYLACKKNHISFQVEEKEFSSKEEVIRWLIMNYPADGKQDPMVYRYQIGKRYCVEKELASRLRKEIRKGKKAGKDPEMMKTQYGEMIHPTDLTKEYHISLVALRNYRDIAAAVDVIAEKEKRLADKYLSGELRIKREDLFTIAKLPAGYVRALVNLLIRQKKTTCRDSDILKALSSKDLEMESKRDRERRKATVMNTQPSVKDMPVYDPDGEVASLSLTIPSWYSSIDRVVSTADMGQISQNAANQLKQELMTLRDSVDLVLLAIEEES